jgi:hypothetical protein
MTKTIQKDSNYFFDSVNSIVDKIKKLPGYARLGLTDAMQDLENSAQLLRGLAKISIQYLTATSNDDKSSLVQDLNKAWAILSEQLSVIDSEVNAFLSNSSGVTKEFLSKIVSKIKDILNNSATIVQNTGHSAIDYLKNFCIKLNNKIKTI